MMARGCAKGAAKTLRPGSGGSQPVGCEREDGAELIPARPSEAPHERLGIL